MKDDLFEIPPEEPYEPTLEEIEDSQYVGSDREAEEFGELDEFCDDDHGLDDDDAFDESLGDFDDESDEDFDGWHFLNALNDEDVEIRTAVMLKNGMVALLCIRSASQGAAICRVDPREPIPAVQLYDDRDAATNWYARSLESSKRNGWRIAYYGLPLRG